MRLRATPRATAGRMLALPGRRLSGGLVVAGLLLLLFAGALTTAGSTAAQDMSGARGTSAEVVELAGILHPDDTVSTNVRVVNRRLEPLEDVRLRLVVHERTRSRLALDQAISEEPIGAARGSVETSGLEVAEDSETILQLRADAEDVGLHDAPPGVYPMVITIEHSDGVAAEFTTALVVAPEGGEPLRFTLLTSLRGPVATMPNGYHDAEAIRESVEAINALTERLQVPVPATVVVDGRMVEELQMVADGEMVDPDEPDLVDVVRDALDDLAEVVARDELELTPTAYGPADLVALTRAEMASEAQHLIDRGIAITEDLSGSGTDRLTIVPPRGLNASTAGWLSGVAGGTVLTEEQLGLSLDRDLPATPAAVRTLSGIPGLPVAVPDPLLADVLARWSTGTDAALAAQRVLAETAATFFERPGGSTSRGILLVVPPDAGPPALVPTLAQQMERADWLEAVPLSGLFDQVAPSLEAESLAYDDGQVAAELPGSYLRSVDEARMRLRPLREILGSDATEDFERRLDIVTSVDFRDRDLRLRGRAIISAIAEMGDTVREAVTILEGPPLTLTGAEGTVPVTISNEGEEALNVRVQILTTRYGVEDAGGRDLELPAQDQKTTTFEVEANAPGGTYPISIQVTDPRGEMELATGQVTVRSTAFSVVGVVITGSAALLLVGWVVHALVGRRVGRRGRSDDEPDPEERSATEAPAASPRQPSKRSSG